MSDLLPKEITMYDVPARLSNDEAIGYLQGYNDAVRKLCTTTSTGWQDISTINENTAPIVILYHPNFPDNCLPVQCSNPEFAKINAEKQGYTKWVPFNIPLPPTPPRQDEGRQ